MILSESALLSLRPLSRQALLRQDQRSRRFRDAEPFPHIVLDGFLEPGFCARLAAEFPPYDAERFRNAYGLLGKAVRPDVRALGPAFRQFDEMARSPAFLDYVSRLSGIPGLHYDPEYVGAGAQENLPGMALWPHVDFNRRGKTARRRLNLLLYLNERWRPECGGSLVLHHDPRSRKDRRKRIAPLFNRCAIFATDERSWHSVEAVAQAPAGASPTRRSVSLYFYTDIAPGRKAPPIHGTIWVFAGLPAAIKARAVLSQAGIDAVNRALALRDNEAADLQSLPSSSRRWRSPLPEHWRPGLRLSVQDVRWIRMELAARDLLLDVLWH